MTSQPHHVTAAADRVPISQKIAYGMGTIVTVVAVNSVVQLTGLVYVVGLGISAIWIGYAQAFPRFWDALVDPFIGNLSDNSRSRFGRRIPFLIVGGLLIGVSFAALWTVPRTWDKEAIFGYFVVVSLIFYTVVPVYAIPHGALGMELSGDYHEKTSVFAYASFISSVGAFLLPWIYYLANRPFFHGDAVAGTMWVCMGMSVVLMGCALWCALVCRERRREKVATPPAKTSIWEGFRVTYRNRNFTRVVIAFVLLIVGFQLVMGFSNFIQIFYLFGGDKDHASTLMAQNGTLWAAVGLSGVFPMTWFSKRYGKRFTVLLSFAIIILGNVSKIVCYDRAHPWLTFFPTFCLSLGMVFCFSLVNSLLADICDEDEYVSGVRREGIYYAVYNWWWKVAVSIASVISGYLLRLTGFQEAAATQSDTTLFWLRCWEIGLPPALVAISFFLLLRYPLTEARAYEIKELLARRKAEAAAAAPTGAT